MNNPKATQWLTKAGGLAKRLEQARGERSGLSLAKELGWSSSKITRIEQGIQVPKAADITKWAAACDVSEVETAVMLDLLDEFSRMSGLMKQRTRRNAEVVHNDASGLVETATLVRTYDAWTVPPILQLEEYAAATLHAQERVNPGGAADTEDALAARMRRQQLLFDKSRKFEILIDESVLYRRYGGVSALRSQLQFLLTLTKLTFGIVPYDADPPAPPVLSIALYDDEGFAEWLTGDEPVDPVELDMCTHILEQMWGSALKGDEARQLILKAIDRLDAVLA